ncbi:protein of unknown function DUF4216 [Dillenia turbinata]|uniref:DUF4216 domain-containing protein n=1 Tax=Dillenia turbinata TaxID=194707 RepID=A0AAN8UPQ5_9MAGN
MVPTTYILEVEYFIGRKKVLIFKCKWFNLGDAHGIQLDKESEITSINVSRKWYSNQPYMLAQQVQQVFYVEDIKLGKNWYVVEKANPRISYDILQAEQQELVEEVYEEEEPEFVLYVDLGELLFLVRDVPLVDRVDILVVNAEKGASSMQSEHEFVDDDVDDDDDDDDDNDDGDSVIRVEEEEELLTDDDAGLIYGICI